MFTPMTKEKAIEISKWIYCDEYKIYSFQENEETIAELMNGEYYYYVDSNNNLIGYICFGKSATIPTTQKDVYTKDFLDIGLGMRPNLCGKGLGYDFLSKSLSFLEEEFKINNFRLTVAEFNKRAIKVYKKIGFKYEKSVLHKMSKKEFSIMVYAK